MLAPMAICTGNLLIYWLCPSEVFGRENSSEAIQESALTGEERGPQICGMFESCVNALTPSLKVQASYICVYIHRKCSILTTQSFFSRDGTLTSLCRLSFSAL
jgi:hypothetical protein